MRRFFAFAAFYAAALMAPLAAEAGFTVKLYSDPVDTNSDVTFGSPMGEFDSDSINFISDESSSTPGAWPLASVSFGAEVTGFLYTGSAGNYELAFGSDDGAYLFLNGTLAIARPGDQGYNETFMTLPLSAGYTPFRISYYNGPCCGTGLTLTAEAGVTITPVPEPESYALMLAGLGLVGFAARFRRRG